MNPSLGTEPPSEPLPPARAVLAEKRFLETLTCVITHCYREPKAAIDPVPPAGQLHSSRLEMTRKDHKTCCLSGLHPQAHGAHLGDSFRDKKGFPDVTKLDQDQSRLIMKSHGKSSLNQNYGYSVHFGKEHKGPKFNFP